MAKRFEKLINFFYELGSLQVMPRSYNLHMLQQVESVADHSQRVAIIAYLLAKKANVDPHKAVVMAAFHDIPETRTGDSNWHQKSYVTQDEEKAWLMQLDLMGDGVEELAAYIKEYKERKTDVSQLVKDADNIEYVLSLKELALQGNEEAKRRIKEDINYRHLYTKLGRDVMRQVVASRPNEWYQKDRKDTSRKYLVKKKK